MQRAGILITSCQECGERLTRDGGSWIAVGGALDGAGPYCPTCRNAASATHGESRWVNARRQSYRA